MQIKGIYCKTIFHNTNTGYAVFSLKLTEGIEDYNKCYITCMGNIKTNYIGIPLLLEGEFKRNNNELNFAFTDVKPFCRNLTDAETVFSSPVFNKLPKDLVGKMTQILGDNPFEWDNNPNLYARLTDIEGIGPKRAQTIIDNITAYKIQDELFSYLANFGETSFKADEVFAQYKKDTLNKLKKHPYTIGYRMGLSFQCRDAIAKENGYTANSTERLRALIYEVLSRAYDNGNTCFPLDRLLNGIEYTSRCLSSFPDDNISLYKTFALLNSNENIFSYITKNGEVIYYFNYSFINEELLAENVARLQTAKKENKINIPQLIKSCENSLNIKYSDKQKECFNFLKSEGIKIITGGPGTGKSTVINGIIHAFETLYPNKMITMMAPTGRASQKIAEITHRGAGTIHRTLGINPIRDHQLISNFFEDFPADLIVIDETSMLDNEIAGQVFKAARGNATILLVGDIDQLPSVGAGNVLKNLIDSGFIDVVHLDVNYRQGGLSTIAKNAEKIKKGYTDILSDDTFHIIKCKNCKEMQRLASDTFCKLYNPNEPFETQMLNAVKGGQTGVFWFNGELQKRVNKNNTVLQNRFYEFKEGDKVIVTVNNYEQNCFNGDIGTVESIIEDEMNIRIGNDLVTYSDSQLNEVHLAYAMSIHKSQGSEYNNVIICLPEEESGMLKRNLIYTAITRAKKNVYIYYVDNALNKAIMSNNTTARLSNLTEMLERKMIA